MLACGYFKAVKKFFSPHSYHQRGIEYVARRMKESPQYFIANDIPANSIFNQVYMVSVNAAAPIGTGQSMITDPEGNIRAESPSESPAILTDVLNLDEVSRVREYGTAGLNRLWDQFRDDDSPLKMPLYNGQIDPKNWTPGKNRGEAEGMKK